MKETYLIFDYFKEAFHINKANKRLYLPQVVLIVIRLLLIIIIGLSIYSKIGSFNIAGINNLSDGEVTGILINYGLKFAAVIILYLAAKVVIESGIYNLYKNAVLYKELHDGEFWQGVKKYFLRFLLADIVLVIAWIIILIPYFMVGLITLTVGLSVIPILINILLTMWKISIVMDEKGIFKGLGNSFSFAAKHFWSLSLLQIINWSFTKAPVSSSGGATNLFRYSLDGSNINNAINHAPSSNIPMLSPDYINNMAIKVLKIAIAVLIPVISIATLAASLVQMIFQVYFALVLFVTYKNGFNPEVKSQEGEVMV